MYRVTAVQGMLRHTGNTSDSEGCIGFIVHALQDQAFLHAVWQREWRHLYVPPLFSSKLADRAEGSALGRRSDFDLMCQMACYVFLCRIDPPDSKKDESWLLDDLAELACDWQALPVLFFKKACAARCEHLAFAIIRHLVHKIALSARPFKRKTGKTTLAQLPVVGSGPASLFQLDPNLNEVQFASQFDVDLSQKYVHGGSNLLHIACGAGVAPVVDYLLRLGAPSATGISAEGATPLMLATQGRHVEVVKLLLAADAKPTTPMCGPQGAQDTTPLHEAAERGYDEIVALFMNVITDERDYLVANRLGHTALQEARDRAHARVVALLDPVTPKLQNPFAECTIDFNEIVQNGRLVAIGATASVMEGMYLGLPVAIKQINSPNLTDDVKQEVTILRRLNHPNIVRFFGVSRGGVPLRYSLVTEWCSYGGLNHVLTNYALGLSKAQLVSFLVDVVEGMRYLHKQSIFHRDLKSPNILVDRELRGRVADFGFSKDASRQMDTVGGTVGTIPWMSPQVRTQNRWVYTPADDVYSCGVIFWEVFYRLCNGLYRLPYGSLPTRDKPSTFLYDDNPLNLKLATREISLDFGGIEDVYLPIITDCMSFEPSARPTFDALAVRLSSLAKRIAAETASAKHEASMRVEVGDEAGPSSDTPLSAATPGSMATPHLSSLSHSASGASLFGSTPGADAPNGFLQG